MRKAINTQIVSRLSDSLIIIGLQRYDFFFIRQAFFTLFLYHKSQIMSTFAADLQVKRRKIESCMQSKLSLSRHTLYIIAAALLLSISCKNDETYAEQKEKERNAISHFVSSDITIRDREGNPLIYVGRMNVISEDQFKAQNEMTDITKNEYVMFGNSGVYMQIVREGVGNRLEPGQSKQVIARYTEFNILRDSVQSSNETLYYNTTPDIIDISNTYGTYTASFNIDDGGGAMYRLYGSTSVPKGWLVPFDYIRLGRQCSEQQVAKVRLIVPHSQGHSDASSNVYPCFYEITFQEMR